MTEYFDHIHEGLPIEDMEIIAPHLRIEEEITPGVMVRADAPLLRQVIQNLTSNAVKYNVPEGLVRFRLTVQERGALFTLSNSGVGIQEEDRDRIFGRFYRGDKSRSGRTPGAGLGLSLALEIAHAHNGELWLDSSTENLISFNLLLPHPSV